ncbi:PREDICTED: uncharacterized protein LOC107330709 isoform X3 [Acropora digitifera]|uniref:uncharacterized protein LOC107330709 isoform X3 n=1 Tax=Acropora digitifera TaxID=70779 RepID=UPI00077A8703|nr:PREDICTED: uncharacterized protein LOC107330709 isoform X3 [Acropora digitifera]
MPVHTVGVMKNFTHGPHKTPVRNDYWNAQYTYYFVHLHGSWLKIETQQIIHLTVSTDEEQEIAVKRMLHYIGQMPSQEVFQPPPVPFVSLPTNVEGDCIGNTQSTSESIQDCTYLSNEKDVSLWKMLVACPTKCNVFVGGLSPEMSSEILQAAFKTFVVEEEEKDKLKAHVVLDFKSQHSRGYGFVTFPNRRSTELGLICMQDFEIYGRTMQLGWGQKNQEGEALNDGGPRSHKSELQNVEQHALKTEKKKNKKGNIVCDTVYLDAKDPSLNVCCRQANRHSSRWDQEMPKKYERTTEDTADQDEHDNGRGAKNQRVIQWVTHAQKVALIKLVCANLRSQGVTGHMGVFGVHYEADNSRLYVVCAKYVTEPQLYNEFTVFGPAQVKLNFDANGLSKGCAFIQYTNSKSAEKAIKQLHGKVVGGMPMKVMVAEPKVHRGSRKKNVALQM